LITKQLLFFMITCYILDDEEYSINHLTEGIEQIPGVQLIGKNTNPLHALKEIQQNKKPDILFLDIEMPELSGIDLAKLLPQGIAIIVQTSFLNYAHHAFEIDAVDFLFKPYHFSRLVKSITKAQHFLSKAKPNHHNLDFKSIFINSNVKGKVNQIIISEIIYIETLDHIISIHTQHEVFRTRLSLKEIEEKLPQDNFIKVHRAFIVNIDSIKSYDGNGFTMLNNLIIPLGEIYKEAFRNKLKFRTIKKS
jgi:DNA-binding LytR/AlgR family response regulator